MLLVAVFLLFLPDALLQTSATRAQEKATLEAQAQALRQRLAATEGRLEGAALNYQLGLLLYRLNFLFPDGARRIPEAEQAYRCCLPVHQPTASSSALVPLLSRWLSHCISDYMDVLIASWLTAR